MFLLLLSMLLSGAAAEEAGAESDIISVTIDSAPRVTPIIIDDIIYLPEQQPVTFGWEIDSSHVLEVPQAMIYEGSGTRYVFNQWNDQKASLVNEFKVTKELGDGNRKFIAMFDKQYRLTVISEFFPIAGSGWYNEGERVTLSVDPFNSVFQPLPEYRRSFAGWSAGFTPNDYQTIIEVNGPTDVLALWREEFMVTVDSEIGHIDGSGWYERGSTATIIAPESVEINGTQYKFRVWEAYSTSNPADRERMYQVSGKLEDQTSHRTSFIVDGYYKIRANWDRHYKVTVNSDFGNPEGEGYYHEGEIATLSITAPVWELEPDRVRLVFAGWNDMSGKLEDLGDSTTINVRVDEPKVFEPVWIKQYNIRLLSEFGLVRGSGWYDEGSIATMSIDKPSVNIGLGKSAIFQGWASDGPASISKIDSTTYAIAGVDQPYTLTAEWSVDETFRYVIMADMLAAAAISGFLLLRTRSKTVKARR